MEQLLKELNEKMKEIILLIENGKITKGKMERFREDTFSIQKRMWRISHDLYTEELCRNIRNLVWTKYQYFKL